MTYTETSLELFHTIVPELRRYYKPDDIELLGTRFNSDEYVLRVLQQDVPEATFKQEPLTSVNKALSACASADHYYATEKSYE